MTTFKLFRWKSRVKSGTPEVAGGAVETLASHVSDENAHPDYLKKGAVVPTGQEATSMGKHLADKIAHAWHLIRRPELLRTKAEFVRAKEKDYAQDFDNFLKAHGVEPHIVTAYVLGLILQDYVDKDTIKEMVKHKYQEAVGDGSQLLYVAGSTDDAKDGFVHLSDKNIGTDIRPVYLKKGTITPLKHDAVLTDGDQVINGTKEFNKTPKVTINAGDPQLDLDLVNLGYLKRALQLPIHSIYSNTDMADPRTTLGYGTWQIIAELGNFGYAWERIA